ncbi:hypothetical protein [Streptomyces wuyuanensis]|uniref:hypothetical protein n=1 Tax=Streptomyces wuyuanensis TaxID=1196353 RepID=UPI00371987BE
MPPPEPLRVRSTRLTYDTVAGDYEDPVRDEPATKPLDRAMLGAFAEVVRAAGAGPVASYPPRPRVAAPSRRPSESRE